VKILLIDPNYPTELLRFNRDCVVLVVSRESKEVVRCKITVRERLFEMFEVLRREFNPVSHYFVMAGVCVTGELIDEMDKPLLTQPPTTERKNGYN